MASQTARSKKSPADAQEARINRTFVMFPKLGRLAIGSHAAIKNSAFLSNFSSLEDPKAELKAYIRERTKDAKSPKTGTPLNLSPMKRNKKNGIQYQDRDPNVAEMSYKDRSRAKTAARKSAKTKVTNIVEIV